MWGDPRRGDGCRAGPRRRPVRADRNRPPGGPARARQSGGHRDAARPAHTRGRARRRPALRRPRRRPPWPGTGQRPRRGPVPGHPRRFRGHLPRHRHHLRSGPDIPPRWPADAVRPRRRRPAASTRVGGRDRRARRPARGHPDRARLGAVPYLPDRPESGRPRSGRYRGDRRRHVGRPAQHRAGGGGGHGGGGHLAPAGRAGPGAGGHGGAHVRGVPVADAPAARGVLPPPPARRSGHPGAGQRRPVRGAHDPARRGGGQRPDRCALPGHAGLAQLATRPDRRRRRRGEPGRAAGRRRAPDRGPPRTAGRRQPTRRCRVRRDRGDRNPQGRRR